MYEGSAAEEIDRILRESQERNTGPYYDAQGYPTYLDDEATCAALGAAAAQLSDGAAPLIKRHGDNGHIEANQLSLHSLPKTWMVL